MTENILQKNLQYIAGYNKDLERKISGLTELEGNFEIKHSRSGDPILYKDNTPTDDTVDPVWSSLEEYKKLKFKIKRSITVVIGLGLGYKLKELANRYAGKIIIYEPDINLLRIALEVADLSEFLQKDNVKIVSSYSELESVYSKVFFIHYKLNICCSDYYLMNHSGLSADIKKKLEDLHSIYQSNYRNLLHKNYVWTNMTFKNIPQIIKNPDLDVLKDKFKGKTAVIISAGPSLDKNIRDLKPYRDKAVVFCVGTALKTVIKHGIIPDFALAVEIFKSTLIHLDVPEISDINLILSTRVYPGVYKLNALRIYNYHGENAPASKWLGQTLEKSLDLYKEAGTVSLTAFYSARMLGFDRIILIGQDLAYTDNRCYSKDTVFGNFKVDDSKIIKSDNTEHAAKTLGVTEEKIHMHGRFLGNDLLYVKGYREGKVLTNASLFLFIKYFEEIAEKLDPGVKLVNATEGGVYLKGLEHIPLKEALQKYTDQEVFTKEVLESSNIRAKQVLKRRKIVVDSLREIIKNYYKAREIITPIFEKEIKERFRLKDDAEEFEKYKKKYDINSLNLKETEKAESLTTDENHFLLLYINNIKKMDKKIKDGADYFFDNDFESFSQNLRLVKENYLKAEKILSKNPYIHNIFFQQFLISNFLLKDFDPATKGCLKCISNYLNTFLLCLYFSKIETVKEIVKELES